MRASNGNSYCSTFEFYWIAQITHIRKLIKHRQERYFNLERKELLKVLHEYNLSLKYASFLNS